MVVARTITILRNYGLVIELRISKTLVDPEIELIKANASLRDGSILFVNEAAGWAINTDFRTPLNRHNSL
jgi:hypothetical protein